MKNKFLLSFLLMSSFSFGQDFWFFRKNSQDTSFLDNAIAQDEIETLVLEPEQLNSFFLKEDAVPSFSKKAKGIIEMPNELGTKEKFDLQEVQVLSAALSKEHPKIRSYVGRSLDRQNVTIRWSVSPLGLNAMIQSPQGIFFIQPKKDSKQNEHLFYKRGGKIYDDFERLNCLVGEQKEFKSLKNEPFVPSNNASKKSSDQKLKTYRIAISTTGEFTNYWGDDDDSNGTNKEDALAKVVSTINRVNQIFERDLGVHLELVTGLNLIYDDPDTDPYENDFNEDLQEVLTDLIGEANYDLGHLFDFGSADGNAGSVGNVCTDGRKGRAFTSHPFTDVQGGGEFLNDYFDIDFVAHEIGHQFGGYHTFSHQNESAATHVEPGSGTTIMAYAGVTPNYNDNIQNHSDTYFHYISIKNIEDYIAENSCQSSIEIENRPPVVSAGENISIPKGTAYELRAIGSDPDNDQLTYCWEQLNNGLITYSNFGPTVLSGSTNRSFPPTTNPNRTVPSMTNVLAGKLTQTNPQTPFEWQSVSTVQRNLLWGVTVRDRTLTSEDIGQTAQDNKTVSVVESAGPFRVLSQNSNTTVWLAGANEVIRWDVANTNLAPINTERVSVYLSLDNGKNFSTLLASNTLNDGQLDFVVPGNISSTNARIKIVPENNIYFAVNSERFSILERPFATPLVSTQKNECGLAEVSFEFKLNKYQDSVNIVSMSLIDVPPGVNYSINPLTPSRDQTPGVITLSNLSNLAPGNYEITLVSRAGSVVAQQTFEYNHQKSFIDPPSNLSPTAADGIQPTQPNFVWSSDVNVDSYLIEISLTETFDPLVVSSTTNTSTFIPSSGLSAVSNYYWRVKGYNECGESPYSAIQNFNTNQIDCQPIGAAKLPIQLEDATVRGSGITYADVFMANDYPITDIDLEVSIEHTFLSDLILSLIAPDGTEVVLAKNIGLRQSNFENTVFDQEGSSIEEAQAPFSGSFQPKESLEVFNGKSSYGRWRLKVEDVERADTGRIQLFNINFCVNGTILFDDDFDLVPNDFDNCPLVSNQEQSDSDDDGLGDLCDVDTFNNFTISKIDETCISRNNGAIQISAVVDVIYDVQVTGPNGFNKIYQFSDDTLNNKNLESGDYLICFTANAYPNYESCFTASILEPESLEVSSFVDKRNLNLTLILDGATEYTVSLNEVEIQFKNKEQLNFSLRKGLNTVEVSTNLSCQGSFRQEIYIAEDSVLYPNPSGEEAYVMVGGSSLEAQYIIFDIQGNILLDRKVQLELENRKIPIDMSSLAGGNYFIKIKTSQNEETIKFIRR